MAVAKVILNGATLIDTTQKTVTAASMLNGITALKNDGTDITGSIASKTSSDLTASGATVTAPAGYYASSASKAVASGSATTPATTITANPSISVSSGGLITASVSASQSVTPTVSAGYVSSGTAGTVSVSGSNTSQLTTQAAQTITPTTTNQTIASGKFLTGTQTILGDANLVAANIADGVTIFGVTGTHQGGGGGKDVTVILKSPRNPSSFYNVDIYKLASGSGDDRIYPAIATITSPTGSATVHIEDNIYGLLLDHYGDSVNVYGGTFELYGGVSNYNAYDSSIVEYKVDSSGAILEASINYDD